ncbi:hypothetical protein CLV56_0121 [Mumia flava]|uniref:Uncharacterized protein n=1 Tax=Mumia flava TaxID=1348852 RepID=A0A0B2BD71_9ACTN|nr:hypothetical protein [Mumia flava]PJJ55918.1 hypothetical protein CLV56_0121 [Mumia flava]
MPALLPRLRVVLLAVALSGVFLVATGVTSASAFVRAVGSAGGASGERLASGTSGPAQGLGASADEHGPRARAAAASTPDRADEGLTPGPATEPGGDVPTAPTGARGATTTDPGALDGVDAPPATSRAPPV